MQARHARATGAHTAGVERAAVIFAGDSAEQAVQFGFEDRLQAAEDEIATGGKS